MDQFEFDFSYLNSVVNPDKSRVAYKGNEDKFVRVAFDLFKMRDNSCEDLWQIQAGDDGVEYLVRTYEVDDAVTASDWSVVLDKTASNLTVAYKGMPIHRIASKNYGVNDSLDALILRDVIQEKLATSKEFLSKFANELPKEKLETLVEMGAIDPADLAKAPEDFPETYHGPGFQAKGPVDPAEKAVDITEQKPYSKVLIDASLSKIEKHIEKMERNYQDVSDLYEVLIMLRELRNYV